MLYFIKHKSFICFLDWDSSFLSSTEDYYLLLNTFYYMECWFFFYIILGNKIIRKNVLIYKYNLGHFHLILIKLQMMCGFYNKNKYSKM